MRRVDQARLHLRAALDAPPYAAVLEPEIREGYRTRGNDPDDERSWGCEPVRAVPQDRTVILCLASTKRLRLEDPNELRERVEEAARVFALKQLGARPQCGFASQIEGSLTTHEDRRRKLELVGRVAADIWA